MISQLKLQSIFLKILLTAVTELWFFWYNSLTSPQFSCYFIDLFFCLIKTQLNVWWSFPSSDWTKLLRWKISLNFNIFLVNSYVQIIIDTLFWYYPGYFYYKKCNFYLPEVRVAKRNMSRVASIKRNGYAATAEH